ncbi:MAG: extracellular solute-binding protein [Phycisphaerales bacterium]
MRLNQNNLRSRTSIAFALLVALVSMSCDGAESSDPSSVGTEVVVYCSVDQEYAEELFAAFERAHPEIEVRTRFDTEATKTTGLVERLRAERERPQADLFWSSEAFLAVRLANEGLFQPLPLISTYSKWPEAFRSDKSLWFGFAGRARVIAYNPSRVSDPPMSWRDLTKPEYAGRVVMADPNFGTTRGHIAAWFHLWGADEAEAFLEALAANDLRIVQSNSQTVREVTSGLADFALTDTDDVWAAERNGHELAVVYPRHGDADGEGTLLIPNTLGFVAGRPFDESIMTVAEYILSRETERLLAESDSHNIPLRYDDIPLDDRYRAPDPLVVNYEEVAAVMDDAIEVANRIFK